MRSYSFASITLLLVVPGCTFNPSGVDGPGTPPDAGDEIDAPPVIDAAPDANQACGGQLLSLALSIDGVAAPPAPGEPYVEVLPGDLVTISAAGSCAQAGDLALAWNITPDDGILATAAPALADAPETFTVYAATPGDYTVELTVSGSGAAPLVTSVLAIRVHGWQASTVPVGMGEVRDLSVGGCHLWIASFGGAYRAALGAPPGELTLVNDLFTGGDSIADDLNAVFYDERPDGFVWFGRSANDSNAWRVEPAGQEILQINYETIVGGTASVHDIAAAGTNTILLATSRGITELAGAAVDFTGDINPNGDTARALATNGDLRLAGARKLYELGATTLVFDVAASDPDHKIRTMLIDGARNVLWAGTDDKGVAEFDLATDTPIALHDMAGGLGSNRVRALALETTGTHAGDLWVATDQGVSRYISRRQIWLHMDANHGLSGHVDVNALLIDEGAGPRTIYAGSSAGLVYIHQP